MMLIGIALSALQKLSLDIKMLSVLLFIRCVLWPTLAIMLILIDKTFWHLFGAEIHLMILLIGIIPLPANSIAYASHIGLDAGKMALCVLISTLWATIYVPMMIYGAGGLELIAF